MEIFPALPWVTATIQQQWTISEDEWTVLDCATASQSNVYPELDFTTASSKSSRSQSSKAAPNQKSYHHHVSLLVWGSLSEMLGWFYIRCDEAYIFQKDQVPLFMGKYLSKNCKSVLHSWVYKESVGRFKILAAKTLKSLTRLQIMCPLLSVQAMHKTPATKTFSHKG